MIKDIKFVTSWVTKSPMLSASLSVNPNTLRSKEKEKDPHASQTKHLSPKQFYRGLNEHVIGQHAVKVALSVGVHNHLIRARMMKPKSKANNPNVEDATQLVSDFRTTVGSSPQPITKSLASFPSREGLIKPEGLDEEVKIGDQVSPPVDDAPRKPTDSIKLDQYITLRSGKKVESVSLEKTNILLLGPTGKIFLRDT